MPPLERRPWFPGGERVAFFLLLVATLYGAYLTIRPVLLAVVLAASVASLSFPLYERIARGLGNRRRLAAALSVGAVLVGAFGSISLFGALVVQRLVFEAGELSARVRTDQQAAQHFTDRLGPLGPPVRRLIAQIAPAIESAAPTLARRGAELLATIGSAVVQIAAGIFLLAISTYYFYLNGRAWQDRLVSLAPLPPDDVRSLFRRFHSVSVGVLIGNLGTAAVQGTLGLLGYWALGVAEPLLWAVATAISSLIPPLGTAIVWVPLAIGTGIAHGWWRGALLGVFGGFLVGAVDNVLRPLLTRNALQIHPLLVFLSVFGGLASFGVAGLFLGPLAVALAITVIDIYRRPPAGEPFSSAPQLPPN